MKSEWRIHPDLTALDDVLEDTYGIIVFQEQVLETLNVICGWSYAEAGLLFDAMRKKNHEKMASTKPDYLRAARSKGYSDDAANTLWEHLVPFADYSFNRAHTAGYGLVAYWTAYLKANYPVEYMSALLSSVTGDPEKLQEYLDESQRMGIPLLPPHINVSNDSFTPDGHTIRYGLSAIRGVGDKATEAIFKKRPYHTFSDFLMRAPMNCLNIGVVTALVKSGALDGLVTDRAHTLERLQDILDVTTDIRRAREAGQPSIAPLVFLLPAQIADRSQYQEWEEEVLGVRLSKPKIVLSSRGWLQEPELEFLKRTIQEFPGSQEVLLDFGWGQILCGTMNGTEAAVQKLKTLRSIEVEEQ